MDGYEVVSWADFDRAIEDSVRTGLGADEPLTQAEKTRAAKPVSLPKRVGAVVLNGRPGTVYLGEGDAPWRDHYWAVITTDPKLRPLAGAWLRFFRSRPDFYEAFTGVPDQRLHELAALMTKGAPLEFGDLQLVSVKFDPIDDGRFRLPATPLTYEQYRKRIGDVGIGPATDGHIPQRKP